MDVYSQIREKLMGCGNTKRLFMTGKVKSVDGESCVVEVDGLELTDVKLRAVINGNKEQVTVTPKVGSYVQIADLSNGEMRDTAVIKVSEVESISIITGNTDINISDDGISVNAGDGKLKIMNGSQSLFDLIDSLITAITKLTVTTGTGPSGTPINATDFINIQNNLKQLMK